jgi:hypothetical protein
MTPSVHMPRGKFLQGASAITTVVRQEAPSYPSNRFVEGALAC